MGAGQSGGTNTEAPAASLAAGLPETLDWRTLIEHVFQPAHEATALVTPSEGDELQPVEQCKVQCFSGTMQGPLDPALLFSGRVGMVSQKGKKPGPNQDSAFFMQFLDGDGSRIWMSGIMDGHGPLGHEISRLAIQWLPLLILREPSMAREPGLIVPRDPQAVLDGILAAFSKAGSLLLRASAGSFQRQMSGSTCSFCLCGRGILHSAWIGDSRAVLGTVRQEAKSAFALDVDTYALTRDHKPEDIEERRRIEAHGGRVEQKRVWLREFPQCGLNLSRSFGDALAHNVGVSHVPDVTATFLQDEPGQFAVLASDGVWEFLSSADAVEAVGAHLQEGLNASWKAPSQEACSRLVRRATDCWRRECNEMDDITAVLVQV